MPIDFQTLGGGFGRVTSFRAGVLAWPAWARVMLIVPMVPGILLLALSIVVFLVSLVALFVLTAPVYLLLAKVFAAKTEPTYRSPGSKRVEAVIRDA